MELSRKVLLVLAVCWVGLIGFSLDIHAVDTVPTTINYQGTLTDGAGQSVSGTKNIVFSLYSVPSGGVAFWTSGTRSVAVTNGSFSVALGDSPALNPANLTGTTYIGIKVESDPEMAPRQQFTSVAYALKAGNAINIPDAIPQGAIIMWGGVDGPVPAGWALCDGGTYAAAGGAMLQTPDLRSRFVVGSGTGAGLSTYAMKATGGEEKHALAQSEMPSHSHLQDAHTHPQNPHQHQIATSAGDTTGSGYIPNNSSAPTPNVWSENATATNQSTTATNQNAGGGTVHENRPPYYALAFIMKL